MLIERGSRGHTRLSWAGVIGLVALIAVKTPWFHPAASLLPLLFPNIVISIMKINAGRGA